MKKRIIYSLYIANELTKRGHQLLEAQPHKDKPNVLVFWFEATEDFDQTVNSIVEERRSLIQREKATKR